MKRIYSIFERLASIFTILLLGIIVIILFVKYNSNITLIIIAYVCIIIIIVCFLKIFSIPSHIVIKDNKIKVFDFPLFATNNFYVKKRSLILYNSEIDINNIEKIEIISLTRDEQICYIGYKHLLKKFLKFSLKHGNPKYVYVGNYSKHQIKKIIKITTNK